MNLRINPQIKAATFFHLEPTEPVLGPNEQEQYFEVSTYLACVNIVNQKFKSIGNAKFTIK